MLATRLLLRRPPRVQLHSFVPGLRLQHNQYGPHKEYFQHPSQYPPNFQPRPDTFETETPQSAITPSQQPQAKKPSLIRVAIRNVFITQLCLLLGFLAGTAVVTWDYIQPPYAPDSEEHQELQEEIEELIETCPISENLRENGWSEEPIIKSRSPAMQISKDQHLVDETLSGVQGVTMKIFRHPTMHASALVFFAGFGIEGWPDTVHGGALVSMMNEAYAKHMQPLMEEEGLTWALDEVAFDDRKFAFLNPVRPGEIYTIMIMRRSWGVGQEQSTGDCYVSDWGQALLMSIDAVPFIRQFESPEKPGQFLMQVSVEEGALHATGDIQVLMKSDRISRHDGESSEDYYKRFEEEVEKLEKKTFVMDDAERQTQQANTEEGNK